LTLTKDNRFHGKAGEKYDISAIAFPRREKGLQINDKELG
jgi:hypothetical protein